MNQQNNAQIAMRVSLITIIWNVLLSAFKLLAGLVAHSSAMLSDAVHSLSDVLSTVIVLVGIRLANRDSDTNHPYGHERLECVAAILLSVLLFATGAGIGYAGIARVLAREQTPIRVPGTLALVAAVISIATKEAMYWYTRAAAKKTSSGALLADAWHHRSDALSSVGSMAGILGAQLGYPILDPLAGVVICVFILKVSWSIFIDAISKMTDQSCNEELLLELHRTALDQPGVLGVDQLKARLFGDRIYVDVEICADGSQPLCEAHDVAHRVHDAIEDTFPAVKHCMVHVNPTAAVPQKNRL